MILYTIAAAPILPVWAQSANLADRIVAVVNNEPVTQSEVDDILGAHYFKLRKKYEGPELAGKLEEARISALSQLIEDLLIYQEAQRMEVKITDQEVDEMITKFKRQFPSEENVNQALKERGLTMERLRKSYRKQIAVQKLHAYRIRSRVIVSPQEIEEYYRTHPQEFTEDTHWFLSTITIKKNADDVTKGTTSEDKKKLVDDLLVRIKAGESFADLAKQYSEDSQATKGGEMLPMRKGDLRPEIEAAIVPLKKGEVSEVIESATAYHLFKVDDVTESKTKPLSEVRDYIYNRLYSAELKTRYETWINDLKNKSYISIK